MTAPPAGELAARIVAGHRRRAPPADFLHLDHRGPGGCARVARIARRRRIAQHLLHSPAVDAEPPPRLVVAQPRGRCAVAPISCAASTGSDRIQVRHDRRQTDHRWPITGPVRLECRVEPNIGRRQGPQPPLSRTWPTPTVSSKRLANPERFWHAFPRGSVPTWGIPD